MANPRLAERDSNAHACWIDALSASSENCSHPLGHEFARGPAKASASLLNIFPQMRLDSSAVSHLKRGQSLEPKRCQRLFGERRYFSITQSAGAGPPTLTQRKDYDG